MAYRLPAHLHRSRHGTLYFRIAIPADLRHHFATREIYRSLRTPCVREAVQAAQSLSIAFKRVFSEIRRHPMSDTENTPEIPIDPDKLRELLLLTKQRFHYEEKLDAQEARIAKAERLLQVARRQHERELNLVLQARTIPGASHPGAATDPPGLPQRSSPKSPLFSELIDDYKRDRLAANKWTLKTQDENLAVYKLCVDIIGDQPLNEIGEDQALTYVETLKKLPANMNKMPAYRGKTISEIIALNPPPMATRTINKSLERISSLFKFAISKPKYDLHYNPFSGRSLDESNTQQREPFTIDELTRIFGAAEHAQRRYRTAYSYWLPIMGLLTGARLNELCQLHLSDFEVVGGIHCINIRDAEDGQRVKNKSARRLVPIHDKLIEVGLVRYVERLRAQSHNRFFPTLELTEDGYGKMPSRWFGRFKERCGIMEKHTKVFHSFRHTFISTLLNSDVPETAIAPIVGHEGMLVTSQIYWNVRDPVKRKPTVDKFRLPLEVWNLVPKVEDIVITNDGV
jgi:integrase